MESNFGEKELANLRDAKNAEECRELFLEYIKLAEVGKSKRPVSPRKMAYYKWRVYELDTKAQIMHLFSNMLLVGYGLGAINSSYQRNFGSWGR